MAIKLVDTARPNNHVDNEHLGTFPVVYAEDVWFRDKTRLSEKKFYDGSTITQKIELTGMIYNKTWGGLQNFNGKNVWTDGYNIYYSYGTSHYVLNKVTSEWEAKTWSGLVEFDGSSVWLFNGNAYCLGRVLNRKTSTWQYAEGFGVGYGEDIWTDGYNIYYDDLNGRHKIFNKQTLTWEDNTWTMPLTYWPGRKVWTDGDNFYFSDGSYQFVLDKQNATWENKIWKWEGTPSTNLYGNFIWTDGYHIYFSNGTSQSYVLDKQTSTWREIEFSVYKYFNGENVWSDGKYLYISQGSTQCTIEQTLTPSNKACLLNKLR